MGIRVHKVLGYGLTDVKVRKYQIADGRINRKSPLLDWNSKATFDDYLDWLEQQPKDPMHFNMDTWFLHERKEPNFNLRELTGETSPRGLVHWGSEYMEKNVLLVRPLTCKDWNRHDDPIDYIEEAHKYQNTPSGVVNWYREIPEGIFPYSSSWMNARTGDRVRDGITLWRIMHWDGWDKFYDLDKAAVDAGFIDAEDVKQNFVPVVPNEIRDLCEWGELFTNDDVWKQLRPLIYTYWS